MITQFRDNIAVLCGMKAAIVAEILWDQLDEQIKNDVSRFEFNNDWCRCSQFMVTVICPCLTIHMVKDAIATLIDHKIIRKGRFNDSKFDHTNWYAFTEYGEKMMLEGDNA